MEEGGSLLLASDLLQCCQQSRADPRTRAWGGLGSKAKLVRGFWLLGSTAELPGCSPALVRMRGVITSS